jgi:hypothetical protein
MAAVSAGGCKMKMLLDGFKLELLPDESVDDWVTLANIVGIEVYPAAGGTGTLWRVVGSTPTAGW